MRITPTMMLAAAGVEKRRLTWPRTAGSVR